jgi:hypothetical protein
VQYVVLTFEAASDSFSYGDLRSWMEIGEDWPNYSDAFRSHPPTAF